MDQKEVEFQQGLLRERQRQVRDLGDQQFRSWRHHPVSQVVLHYLEDYRRELLLGLQQRWLGGSLELRDEREGRGRALLAEELVDLEWSAIEAFYGIEQKPEEWREVNGA